MSTPRKVKCSRVRACKWEGTEADFVFVPSKKIKIDNASDATCPRCGGKEFYSIKNQMSPEKILALKAIAKMSSDQINAIMSGNRTTPPAPENL